MTKPIVSLISFKNYLFRLFSTKKRVQIWLYDQNIFRLEGKIIGFDEYMNLVIDECEEYYVKNETRVYLGRIMLKGDNISLVCPLDK